MRFSGIEGISRLQDKSNMSADNADLYQGKEALFNNGAKKTVTILGIEDVNPQAKETHFQSANTNSNTNIETKIYSDTDNISKKLDSLGEQLLSFNNDKYMSTEPTGQIVSQITNQIDSQKGNQISIQKDRYSDQHHNESFNSTHKIDIPVSSPKIIGSGTIDTKETKICVIGVGGAGVNAVKMMIHLNLIGVDIVAANTDAQTLRHCDPNMFVLPLGNKVTKGLGTGGDPIKGAEAAREVRKDIFDFCKDYDMIFLTTGFGGGTGTGATPIIAEIAKEAGTLTIAVVTMPFNFEGSEHQRIANDGLKDLEPAVDSLVVIPNDNVINNEFSSRELNISEALRVINDVLISTVRNITDIITLTGMINVDYADLQSCLSAAGRIAVGFGSSHSEERKHGDVHRALDMAMRNTIISRENSEVLNEANHIIVNTVVGVDASINDYGAISEYVKDRVHRNGIHAIKHGFRLDPNMAKGVRIAIIAAHKTLFHDQRGTMSDSSMRKHHDFIEPNYLDSGREPSLDTQKEIVRVNANYVGKDVFDKLMGKSENNENEVNLDKVEDDSYTTPAITRLLKITEDNDAPV